MAPPKRKAALSKDEPMAKRVSKRRGVKKHDDPVWLTENTDSPLVHQDLHAKYCNPATYKNWTKEDWEEIHDCLPENAPFNDDGYSVPMTFFKYDPDWRRYVREFQEDLGAGRYEPEWQKQATAAMEERAAGKFDKFKEDQFEAFWGQKQTLSHEVLAGDSAKVKLSQLVEAGRIKVGDELSYRRSFRSGPQNAWMIEKELKVVAIQDTTLKVAIPPGQLKYPRIPNQFEETRAPVTKYESIEREADCDKEAFNADLGVAKNGICEAAKDVTTRLDHPDDNNVSGNESNREIGVALNHSSRSSTLEISGSKKPMSASRDDSSPGDGQDSTLSSAVNGTSHKEDIIKTKTSASPIESLSGVKPAVQGEKVGETAFASSVDDPKQGYLHKIPATDNEAGIEDDQISSGGQQSPHIDPKTSCFLYDVWTLNGLENRVIEIDGRMDPKDAPISSSWRVIRVQRNNQDLGSLFDMREEFYVWKSPNIVKMPKKSRAENKTSLELDFEGEHKNPPKKTAKASSPRSALQHDSGPKRKSQRSRTAQKSQTAVSGDDNDVDEREDEESGVEHGSDDEYVTTGSVKKSKTHKEMTKERPKRAKGEADQKGTIREGLEEGIEKSNGRKGPDKKGGKRSTAGKVTSKSKSNHTHFCPHCQHGFTTAWSVKNHIQRACKKVPS